MFQRKNHVVEYSILIILISMGTRQTFGLYLQPITDELDIGRELFSLAIALQSIIGGLPFAGVLADRYGSRWVAIGGGLLFAVSMYLMSIVTHWTGLMFQFRFVIWDISELCVLCGCVGCGGAGSST